jgi:hypothetical protein
MRTFMFAAASAAVLILSPTAFAQQAGQSGTADEAKAMLVKAVAAVKADKAKALAMFSKGEGGFLDRDLYPGCANISDGKLVANPNPNAQLGEDARTKAVERVVKAACVNFARFSANAAANPVTGSWGFAGRKLRNVGPESCRSTAA